MKTRDAGIDALRALAVLAMMAAHTSRLIVYDVRPAWCYWILLLEPLIPTLFLFLAGMSLTHSLSASGAPDAWWPRQARRAAALWLVSAVFFSLEEGLRLPDMFVASGILCTIAYAIVLTASLLRSPFSAWALAAALGAGGAAFIFIDRADARPFPLVVGNSPLLPLLLFALAGALWGQAARRFPKSVMALGLCGMAAAFWFAGRIGLETLFENLGRRDATRVLAPPLTGGAPLSVPYYNLGPLLALVCLGAHLGNLSLSRPLRLLPENGSRRLLALGRRALEAYVVHLFLLAMLVVAFGMRPLRSAWQGNAVLLGVIALTWLWAWGRESGWIAYRRGTQSSKSASDSKGAPVS